DFYDNKGFLGASFSPDGQKVLVGSNASGIWNAYAIPVAGGEPEALSTSTTTKGFSAHRSRPMVRRSSSGRTRQASGTPTPFRWPGESLKHSRRRRQQRVSRRIVLARWSEGPRRVERVRHLERLRHSGGRGRA